jgi:nitrite reductase (NADH) small subunit
MTHADQLTEQEFQAAALHLDALVQEFEVLPYPAVQERVFDLLQTVDTIHRAALRQLIDFLRDHGQSDLVERAAEDPIIGTLLLLYDLVPAEELTQLVAMPQRTAPGLDIIPLIQVSHAPKRALRRPIFKPVARLEDVPIGTMKAFDVDSVRILLANVAGEVYAVHNTCPGSAAPLDLGSFSPPIVVCPWHNEAYDIRTGKRVDGTSGPSLAVLPIAIVDGSIQLAINAVADTAVPIRQ